MGRFFLVLVLVVSAAGQQATKHGVERWSIKTSVPAGKTAKAKAVDLADMLALAEVKGVTKDDKRYQSARIPADAGEKFPEGTLISTTGWLHLVAGETDGDYHIQISNSATSGDQWPGCRGGP